MIDTSLFLGLLLVCLIYLLWYAFLVIITYTLNVKETLKIYLIEHKIYIQITKMSKTSTTVIYLTMSLTILYQLYQWIPIFFNSYSTPTILNKCNTSDNSITVLSCHSLCQWIPGGLTQYLALTVIMAGVLTWGPNTIPSTDSNYGRCFNLGA